MKKSIFAVLVMIMASCTVSKPTRLKVTKVKEVNGRYQVTAKSQRRVYRAIFDTLPGDLHRGARFYPTRTPNGGDSVFTVKWNP